MESSEYADNTDPEQLATAHCTSTQQSGGGSTPATAKADRLAAERLRKECHRAEETAPACLRKVWTYIYIYCMLSWQWRKDERVEL